MGFQSSFNQMLGTFAGAALGAKHISEAKQSNRLNALGQAEKLGPEISEHNAQIKGNMNQMIATQRGAEHLKEQYQSGKMSDEAFVKALSAQHAEIKGLIRQHTEFAVRGDLLKQKRDILEKSLGKSGGHAFMEDVMGVKGKDLENVLQESDPIQSKKFKKVGKK